MRAVFMHQTDLIAVFAIAENDQFFAKDLDRFGQFAQICSGKDRVPETAQIFAGRCAGSDSGDLFVGLSGLRLAVPFEIPRKLCGFGVLAALFMACLLLSGWL